MLLTDIDRGSDLESFPKDDPQDSSVWEGNLPCKGEMVDEAIPMRAMLCGVAVFKERSISGEAIAGDSTSASAIAELDKESFGQRIVSGVGDECKGGSSGGTG
jgi:hypothetical protein